jgi:hypothetical protein
MIKNSKHSYTVQETYYRLGFSLVLEKVLYIHVKIRIYKTIILPVVLYGSLAWSLTLRENID